MKKYKFFYHYNKPKSQQLGQTIWSVHFRNKCYFVPKLRCEVTATSKARNKQPRAVIEGHCATVLIEDDTAIIR